MRHLALRRDGRIVSELNVYDFLVQGDKSKDVQLAAGDVVVFQPVGARVALTGALDTQAIFELKSPEEPLGAVLRYAGGAPVLANPNQAQLERIDPTQPKAARSVGQFKLDASGLAQPLRDGDVLTLLAISPQFANAVTLKGHVAQPLRYAWTPGMRLRDLIPDKEALISPDFYRRKNLLVQMLDEDDTLDRRARERALESGAAAACATIVRSIGRRRTTRWRRRARRTTAACRTIATAPTCRQPTSTACRSIASRSRADERCAAGRTATRRRSGGARRCRCSTS